MKPRIPAIIGALVILVFVLPSVVKFVSNRSFQPALSLEALPEEGVGINSKARLILIAGGQQRDSNSIVSTDSGFEWDVLAEDAPFASRTSESLLSYNGMLYMFGGYGYNNGKFNFNDVWKSTNGKEWELVTHKAPWKVRSGNAALVFGNYMWVVGGETFNAGGSDFYNDVWVSQNGFEWNKMDDAPFAPRTIASSFVFDNKMWFVGGASYNLTRDGDYDFTLYKDIWSFDGKKWVEELSTAPWGEVGPSNVMVYKGELIAITEDGLGAESMVWKSTNGRDWELLTDGPNFPNYNATSFIFNDKMWLAGGSLNEEPYSGAWSSFNGMEWILETSVIKNFSGEGHSAVTFFEKK